MHVKKSVWVSGPMHVKKSVWVRVPCTWRKVYGLVDPCTWKRCLGSPLHVHIILDGLETHAIVRASVWLTD